MKNNIKHTLWQTLRERQLILEYDSYIKSISQINRQGDDMWNMVQKTKNGEKLKKLLLLPEIMLTEADIIRVLGFGVVITQYLIAPIPIPQISMEQAIYCGAIANLLVTLFDHFTDNQLIKGFKLIDITLIKTNSFIDTIKYGIHYLQGNSYQRLICHLIHDYFCQIEALSDPIDTHFTQKKRALNYMIDRMYESEKQTILQPGRITSILWRHKSALPFLAMGMPAWFPTPFNKELWIWHIRWMYSFGDLIGFIDDAVDYENDCTSASPNIYNILTADKTIDTETLGYFANKIADRIVSLQEQYCKHALSDDSQLNQLPMVLISSWYGGLKFQPNDEINKH